MREILESVYFWTCATISICLCTLFFLYAIETIREKRRRVARIAKKQKEVELEGNFRDEDCLPKTVCVSGQMSEEEKSQSGVELDFSPIVAYKIDEDRNTIL